MAAVGFNRMSARLWLADELRTLALSLVLGGIVVASVLALVGASRTYVRVPFLLEGVVQGAIGGLLGVALLFGIFQVAVPQLRDALELFLGWSEPAFLSPHNVGILVAGGAGFGLVGAAVAALRTRVS